MKGSRSTALAGVVGNPVAAMPAPIESDSHALMRMIDRMATDPNMTPERVAAMFEVKERFDAAEARKAFVAAMARFKAEPMEIMKRKRVEFKTRDDGVTSYMHAELSDVTAVVCPAMAKHGLSHAWAVDQANAQIKVTCTVTHELGHSESVTLSGPPDGSGKKNAIQQVASTVTYLQRYTLLAICGLATTGMDDDGRGAGGDEAELSDEERKAAEDLAEKEREAVTNWTTTLNGCDTAEGLKKRKDEMTAAYGGRVPAELVQAYNARLKILKRP